jgi:hypothetical protein
MAIFFYCYIFFAHFFKIWSSKSTQGTFQYFGSGSGLVPDSHESVDPDPGGAKMTYQKRKDLFEVLDVLFGGLDDSLEA